MNMARWQFSGFLMAGCLLAMFSAAASAGVSPGDLNLDGRVDIADLNMVLIDWGKSGAAISDPRADVDGNGEINIVDLNYILVHWGEIADFTLTVALGSGDGTYNAGDVVPISADAAPSEYFFDGWVGDIATVTDTNAADTTLTMPVADIAVTATFETTWYRLTVVGGNGDGDYTAAAVVAILADASPAGQAFDVWLGDITGIADINSAATTITIQPTDATITATYFTLPTYTLTVVSGSGDGNYVQGAAVGISADSPPAGQVFDRWLGDTAGIANIYSGVTILTMPAAGATITATYAITPVYSLTVTSGTGGGSYLEGQTVNVSAETAPAGMEFNYWIGDRDDIDISDNNLTNSSISFSMPKQDITLRASYKETGSPIDYWPVYNYWCKKNFGPKNEPLQAQFDGNALAFDTSTNAEWTHASRTSIAIGFATTLPTQTYIEYGLTTSYGSTVYIESDRYHYVHLGYLTSLSQNTTYHYRLVAEDMDGNTITSSNKTFATSTPGGAILVPGALSGPPYFLNQLNGKYVLTQDITAPYTALEIRAHGITLDLNGHTVTYNTADQVLPSDAYYLTDASFGIRAYWHQDGLRILNGKIVQGEGYNTASGGGTGYSPIVLDGAGTGEEVAGVTVEYRGGQIRGMAVTGNTTAHHNVILDRGTAIANRHQGCDAIKGGNSAYYNLVKRARHRGLNKTGDTYGNEIWADSWATNAHIIGASSYSDIYDNRVFGGGYLAIGIATTGGAYSGGSTDPSVFIRNVEIHDNFVHFELPRPYTNRSDEYDVKAGGHPARVMWGADNIVYHDNMLISYAKDGGETRGVWLETRNINTNVVFRDNLIRTIFENDIGEKSGNIVVDGSRGWTASNESQYMLFERNRLEGNHVLVRIGEAYGQGCNTKWYDNTFVKTGYNRNDFDVLHLGYWYWNTDNNIFVDSLFEGGASYNDVTFDGTGTLKYEVAWTLRVETTPFANVTVENVYNSVIFNGAAGASGAIEVQCTQYKDTNGSKTSYNDYEVTVSLGGSSASTTVTMDARKTLVLPVP